MPPISLIAPSAVQRRRIYETATRYELTAYDAAYLELSQRLSATLYTLGDDLLKLKRRFPLIR